MKRFWVYHRIALAGIAVSVFLLISCFTIAPPDPITNSPALNVRDRITAFALAVTDITERGYDISIFDYYNGGIAMNFNWREGGYGIPANAITHRGTLIYTISPNNVLDVRFERLQRFSDGRWVNINEVSRGLSQLRNDIIANINSLQSNSITLERSMNYFLSNFQYNYLVLKPLTEIGRRDIAQEHLIDRTYSWRLPIVDFQENRNPNYDRNYVATFRFAVTAGTTNFSRLFVDIIDLNVYTDDRSLGIIPRNQVVNFSGVLAGIDDTYTSGNFNFHFFTAGGN